MVIIRRKSLKKGKNFIERSLMDTGKFKKIGKFGAS